MREIKFRAWRESDKQMITENNMHSPRALYFSGKTFYTYEIMSTFGGGDGVRYEDGLILLQYTGLKDKNGVEIYEGDIVIEKSYPFYGNASEITDSNQKCDELNYVGVIVWDDGYYVDLKVVSDRVRGSAIGQSLYDYEELEVIGNIYENKELLESGK